MPGATVVSIVGARPQFIKLAPVCRAFSDLAPDWLHRIVHTGQHYDYGMSEIFFDDLNLPHPDCNLNIRSGKQGEQTGTMITALEKQLEEWSPTGVIVYGDTNSTLAASIAASKLHIPQFHVEAGLRSFDKKMPEEINRVVADHCADLLLAPTSRAMQNLEKEGLGARAVQVGDVMYDAVLYNADVAKQHSNVLAGLDVAAGGYAVLTIHRASNTAIDVLPPLLEILSELAETQLPIVFPIHPRTRAALSGRAVLNRTNFHVIEPQSYLDMLALVQNAKFVLTDSGGLQKEAAFLGKPCVTLRENTEWVETVEIGANRLAGLSRTRIRDAVQRISHEKELEWVDKVPGLYGYGRAADNIAAAIIRWIKEENTLWGAQDAVKA
jgi:UDP-GlcNAc3NAcA epimerase